MLKKRSIQELKFRIMIANAIIFQLINDPELNSDPRHSKALELYTQQRDILLAELHELEPPQPVAIGLKPGVLFADSSSGKEH